MANPTSMQRKNGQCLWFSLLGLGFQPDAAAASVASKTNMKYLNLGPNMFEKPNKDAFYIVTHFLLEKLNPARFHESYRHCWPVLNPKADAEFRKLTCSWLREIMEDSANAGSKVVASLFLSPGGAKFISLMLHLASCVMLQEMKTFNKNGSWVPEAAATPASSSDMAVKRFNLVRSRFLKAAVDQDRFLHEYQRRAQGLVKSMRDIKAESAKYDELLRRCSPDSAEVEPSRSEKIQKVRSLWSDVEAMMSTIREERSAMETVLKGTVEQNVLDGTDRVLEIPRCLQERIEQLPHQLRSGSVYEAGQLNLLCVVELCNHALQLLREQLSRVSPAPASRPSSQNLQEKSRHLSRVLQELHLIRQKVSKEDIPEMRRSIRDLEADWDKRWSQTLKETPLVSFLNGDPALDFLSPMAPLSFEPAAEASYRGGVFSQFPAKLPEEKPAHPGSEEAVNSSSLNTKSFLAAETPEGAPDAAAKVSHVPVNTSLDWLFDTPPSPRQKAPFPVKAFLQASVRKTTHQKIAPSKPKPPVLDWEYENLADQFADAVTTAGPAEARVKGSDLENLLSTLQRDPFSARQQLPRTPESLILDVKSSWRKAVEEDEATKRPPPDELNVGLTDPLDVSSSRTTSCSDSTPVRQQGGVRKSSFLWDTFQNEALDSPSGTGSSAVQFSLDMETLPELPSCDSLLEDECEDMDTDEDAPVLKFRVSPTTTPCQGQNQQTGDAGPPTERTAESLLLDYRDTDWLADLGASEKTHKVFSLDLDSLDTPSPGPKPEYSLPKLIPISPVDDMKC